MEEPPRTPADQQLAVAWAATVANDWTRARSAAEAANAIDVTAEAYHILGLAAAATGNLDEAVAAYVAATNLRPHEGIFHRELAFVQCARRQWSEAVKVALRALDCQPEDVETLHCLGVCALQSGHYGESVNILRKALELDPHSPEVLCDLGRAYQARGDLPESISALRAALREAPHLSRCHLYLAEALERQGEHWTAARHRKAVCRAQPDSASAWLKLALTLWNTGQQSLDALDRALAIGLAPGPEASTAAYLSLFQPRASGLKLRRVAEAACLTSPTEPLLPRRSAHNARSRIGYLSGEFRATPAFHFLSPILANHDRNRFDVFLYHAAPVNDAYTELYRSWAEHWIDVADVGDDEVTRKIRGDKLDLLVDLSGHFPHNRLAVMARRCAPVQMTFPNFPGTTGCAQMDYFVTDTWTSPAGTDTEYTERLLRLPTGYLAYQPPDWMPPVSALSAPRGLVVFGMFQRLGKTNDAVWDAIARILGELPGAYLLVHNSDRLDRPDNPNRKFVLRTLSTKGIATSRLRFVGYRAGEEHFNVIGAADFALDAFPFGGQTTTCECLWMGVPVITLSGNTHVSRVSGGLLQRAGLARCVANNTSQYVTTAVALASMAGSWRRERRALAAHVRSSPVADSVTLVRAMEAAYIERSATG